MGEGVGLLEGGVVGTRLGDGVGGVGRRLGASRGEREGAVLVGSMVGLPHLLTLVTPASQT